MPEDGQYDRNMQRAVKENIKFVVADSSTCVSLKVLQLEDSNPMNCKEQVSGPIVEQLYGVLNDALS
jgi:hypothetical protein